MKVIETVVFVRNTKPKVLERCDYMCEDHCEKLFVRQDW